MGFENTWTQQKQKTLWLIGNEDLLGRLVSMVKISKTKMIQSNLYKSAEESYLLFYFGIWWSGSLLAVFRLSWIAISSSGSLN